MKETGALKIRGILKAVIYYGCVLAFVLIWLDLVLVDTTIPYYCQVNCNWSNKVIVIFVVPLLLLLSFLIYKVGYRVKKAANKRFLVTIIISGIILFFVQVYISYNIYFYTEWDCGTLMKAALNIVRTGSPQNFKGVLSLYPNNRALTAVMVLIMKAASFLGVEELYFPGIIVANAVVNIAGIFTVLSVKKLTDSVLLPWLAWIIYILLVALSPWITIPYSDAYGTIFPVMAFYFYISLKNRAMLKWGLVGFFSFFGMLIKPTTVIVLIAILVRELISSIANKCNLGYLIKYCIPMLVITFLLSQLAGLGVTRILNAELNKDLEVPMTHYLMMGMNVEKTGGNSAEDINYTTSFSTLDEKKKATLQVAKQRISEMGLSGFAQLIKKKTLVNYNDGTFAWGAEGGFYATILPKDNPSAIAFRNLYYHDGEYYYTFYMVFVKIIWMFVLTAILGMGIKKINDVETNQFVALLSIFGLTLFLWIFEARARYLYCFLPMYIICASIGLDNIAQKIKFKKL